MNALFLLGLIIGSILSVAGCVLYFGRNAKPPEGHHFAVRNGKRFVRRNPKSKQSAESAQEQES